MELWFGLVTPSGGEAPEVRWVGWLHTILCRTAVPARPPTHRIRRIKCTRTCLNGPKAPRERYAGLGTEASAEGGFLPAKPSKPKHLGATQGSGSAWYSY